ncbi:MaoC family dehydratase [Dichotomicrobium thermohalophilum]|uniref:3-hydroxybutyryl-CoA dehydratase n=1 Tax=Dichotomicrobium thermohalophilum TaxID=933063 RepID=A0A397Q6S7_9HYPH|nr:MaoC family dehydratase [Dichotomicrobium thermohalophilum]RIA56663.1 3-hydroxybutyryl-CoA dehydratase [Dichotomicrobium thermohalophilum]
MKWLPERMRQALGAKTREAHPAGSVEAHIDAWAPPPEHYYHFEDLAVGMAEEYFHTITDDDVAAFAALTGDTNPVHHNQEYAARTRFKAPIVHGMLTASYISTVLGTKLPGAGAIYLSQTLKFLAPVYHGDTVVARAEITDLIAEKSRAVLRCTCSVEDRVVLEGEAVLMVPRRESNQ